MADTMSMPSGMGGLMRFNEEYASKLKISATAVIIAIAVVVVAITIVKILFKYS